MSRSLRTCLPTGPAAMSASCAATCPLVCGRLGLAAHGQEVVVAELQRACADAPARSNDERWLNNPFHVGL
jgi:hypothetical protein